MKRPLSTDIMKGGEDEMLKNKKKKNKIREIIPDKSVAEKTIDKYVAGTNLRFDFTTSLFISPNTPALRIFKEKL